MSVFVDAVWVNLAIFAVGQLFAWRYAHSGRFWVGAGVTVLLWASLDWWLVGRYLLAYASDFQFLVTAMQPHGVSWLTPGMQVASLDHAMWFHRPFRFDDWLLHVIESPSASGARGLVRGHFFDRHGNLVASTAQEGLMRDWRERDG